MNSKWAPKQKGFTIVELLIVIVVIGILAAITIVAYNGVQQRARDSKRQSDIAVLQKALEMYHVDNGGYPACSPTAYQPGNGRGSCYSDTAGFVSALVPKYISESPKDPDSTGDSRYRYFYGSEKTSDTTYRASADDNYIIVVAYESKGGPYVTQLGSDTKQNYIFGSGN